MKSSTWPLLSNPSIRRGESIDVLDRRTERVWEIAAGEAELDALDSALSRCDGLETIDGVLESVDPHHRPAVEDSLDALLRSGALTDQNQQAEAMYWGMHGRGIVSDAELSEIMSERRWVDDRASNGIWQLADRGTIGRDRSLAVREAIERSTSLAVPIAIIAQALADAYGSKGRWKPVASAGRLWPLTMHVACGRPALLRWFDDDLCGLSDPFNSACSPSGELWNAFLEPGVIKSFLEADGSIVILSADLSRACKKYGNRGLYYSLIECGAVVQNLAQTCSDHRLETRPIGGFWPDRLMRWVGSDDLAPLMAVLVCSR